MIGEHPAIAGLACRFRLPAELARAGRFIDQLLAEAFSGKCCVEDVRVKDDSHDTILNTSSSV